MSTKSFPLEEFFRHIPERYLDKAGVLVEGEKVEINKVAEKGLHVFNVNDDQVYEVELVVGRKLVKKWSCDCDLFMEKQMCQHVAASILTLIQIREKKKKQKKRQAKARKSRRQNQTIQINQILDQVDDRALRLFVKQYAIRNTGFALKLKTQFAHHVELADNLNKYYQLLKRHENHVAKGKLNQIKYRKIGKYISDLLVLSDDLVSQEHYQEAANMIFGVLKYLISRPSFLEETSFASIYLEAHKKLENFLTIEMSPQLVKSLRNQCQHLYRQDQYSVIHDQLNLYYILYHSGLPSEKGQIIQDLTETMIAGKRSFPHSVLTLCRLYAESSRTAKLLELVVEYRNDLPFTRNLFKVLEKYDWNIRYKTALTLYKNAEQKKLRTQAFEQLVKLEKDHQKLEKWYLDFFQKENDVKLLSRIKDIASDWPVLRQQIVKDLKRKRVGKSLCFLYRMEDMPDDLQKYLESYGSMELLLDNASYLYERDRLWLKRQILEVMKNHLNRHLGSQSVYYVSGIIHALNRLQLHKLAREIKYELIITYEERSFFTKALREEVA